jgi:hypothetical protein
MLITAAGPAAPAAVNVTDRLPLVAVSTFEPAAVPRVQLTEATPEASVTAEVAETDPPPLTTENVIDAPANGLPF